ncbi:hypothetical protein SBRY_20740 [Actinacidiphila bryophytorum]|uniref:Uncharacterized protein n=1 Tax=Actinacidiphila bryophytorum TaxID=1436133 RepID=A0A9W4E6K7_9ACTN|nr:hypothetical protein SBRY_20740 [Actinacidiphila bryophytorum]
MVGGRRPDRVRLPGQGGQPRLRAGAGRLHRQGAGPDRRPRPGGLPGLQEPGRGLPVHAVHDLLGQPAADRAEERHAADQDLRLHRRGAQEPDHRRVQADHGHRPSAGRAAAGGQPVHAAAAGVHQDPAGQVLGQGRPGRRGQGVRQAAARLHRAVAGPPTPDRPAGAPSP